ncbi:MAG: mucoidy inhibitor MuiA family protein [Gemmatales bacterium]
MKRSYLFAAVVGCLGLIPLGTMLGHESNTPSKEAKSKITQVTVYNGNALITRDVEVPEGSGLLEIVVNPLPPQVVDGSLYSEGSDGIRILTTRYRTRAIEVDTREEVKKLNQERKTLQLAKQDLESKQKVLTDNIALLAKLEAFTAATMQHLTEKGVLSSDQTISLSKYIMETRSSKSEEMTKVRQQIQANAEADAFVGRKLNEASAGPSRTERDAVITINKANNAGGRIRLNYLVSSATWVPQYKFRAGKDKDPVLVEYLAAIRQQSGEEWANVNITLSTAQPMLNAAPPELKSLAMTLMPGGPNQSQGKASFAGGKQLVLGINPAVQSGQALRSHLCIRVVTIILMPSRTLVAIEKRHSRR